MNRCRKTMVGLGPASEIPFALTTKSGVRYRIVRRSGTLVMLRPGPPRKMSNGTAQCYAFGVICILTALSIWAFS
jgi:hypothetical protein